MIAGPSLILPVTMRNSRRKGSFDTILIMYLMTILVDTTLLMPRVSAVFNCNLFQGSWVYDNVSAPLYDTTRCPFNRAEWDCLRFGRTNLDYLHYRWKPTGCEMPRFNGKKFLTEMRGKKIMFVGDSVLLNQYNSFLCLLHAAVPNTNISHPDVWHNVTFHDYNITVIYSTSHYLVDVDEESFGRVLKLDKITGGTVWNQMDMLVFNTGLWWRSKGKRKEWDYVQEGMTILQDMDRTAALGKALSTWRRWVDSSVNTSKTSVFFVGMYPVHYRGEQWGKPGLNCSVEMTPLTGSSYPGGPVREADVVEDALRNPNGRFHLLNVTTMSQLRVDGHVAGHNGVVGRKLDCTHWCIGGVPDTWTQLLYIFWLATHRSQP